jgi:hypothetical protein
LGQHFSKPCGFYILAFQEILPSFLPLPLKNVFFVFLLGQEETRMDFSKLLCHCPGWLLRHLPSLPCFQLVYPSLATALRQACQVESDPDTVSLYIRSQSSALLVLFVVSEQHPGSRIKI